MYILNVALLSKLNCKLWIIFLSFNFSVKFEKVCDGLSDCAKSSDENHCSDIILEDMYDYEHSKNGIYL